MARPEHQPTVETRDRVATLAGGGMAHEGIAMVLGISRPTLEKHYAAELTTGAYAKRAEVLEAMQAAALKGNVSAGKFYLRDEPGLAAPPLPDEAGTPADGKPEKLGKKEQAARDAKTAADGTDWADLLQGDGKVVAIRR